MRKSMISKYFDDDLWEEVIVMDIKGTSNYSIVKYKSGRCFLVSRLLPWFGFKNLFFPVAGRRGMEITLDQANKWGLKKRDRRTLNTIGPFLIYGGLWLLFRIPVEFGKTMENLLPSFWLYFLSFFLGISFWIIYVKVSNTILKKRNKLISAFKSTYVLHIESGRNAWSRLQVLGMIFISFFIYFPFIKLIVCTPFILYFMYGEIGKVNEISNSESIVAAGTGLQWQFDKDENIDVSSNLSLSLIPEKI